MLRSPLHETHVALGAKLVPFAGWEMPIQYGGIVSEHEAVRNGVGVFDISHMGELEVSGDSAEQQLNRLLTNDLSILSDGEGQYSLMLNERGGVIDDLIVYRLQKDRFFLVVNAAKTAEDVEWLSTKLNGDVLLVDHSESYGGVAVQGPQSSSLWSAGEYGAELPPRNGIVLLENGAVVCRTGYTGEDGFELFDSGKRIGDWFDRFVEAGAIPCGLGARDTLRLEMGYPLNGSDLDGGHTPLEAGLGFFVKLHKEGGFVGAELLTEQKESGIDDRLVALQLVGKAPPLRHGYEVLDPESGEVIGSLTSGSLSPSLKIGIGLAYLPARYAKVGTRLKIEIRGREFPAEIVRKPFIGK